MNYISFPGLGIDTFEVSKRAFSIGKIPVYWYGIIITCGIILAFVYTNYRAKNEKVNQDSLIDVALWTVLLGIVGARLYYVLFSLDHFIAISDNAWEFFLNAIDIPSGGLGIYGGIILGAVGVIISSKIKKINTIKLCDMVAPGVMIAQAMGRWGNFFNGEAYGMLVSENHPLRFLRMGLISSNTVSDFKTYEMVYVHPTFLYESLWNIIGFILINILYKKKKFNGQIVCMYCAWYGFGRMFIEGLRTDSLYIGSTSIRVSQLVGFLCFIIFGTLLVLGLIYSKKFESGEQLPKFFELLRPDVEQKPDRFYHKWFKKEKKVTGENGTNN